MRDQHVVATTDAVVPFLCRGVIFDGKSLNDYKEPGLYWVGADVLDKPSGFGSVLVYSTGENKYGSQVFHAVSGSSYQRDFVNNIFNSWRNLPALSEVMPLKSQIPDNSDLNNLLQTGVYWAGSDVANKPSGFGTLIVHIQGTNYGNQLFYPVNGPAYRRSLVNGQFTAWEQEARQSDIPRNALTTDRIFVQSAQPANPQEGDIWFKR